MGWIRKVFWDEWPKPTQGVGAAALFLCYGVPFILAGLSVPVTHAINWIGLSQEVRMLTGVGLVVAAVMWNIMAWIKVQKWHRSPGR